MDVVLVGVGISCLVVLAFYLLSRIDDLSERVSDMDDKITFDLDDRLGSLEALLVVDMDEDGELWLINDDIVFEPVCDCDYEDDCECEFDLLTPEDEDHPL